MSRSLNLHLQGLLDRRRSELRYRFRQVVESPQGPVIHKSGRELLNFCSNDYLGLANHPDVVVAMQDGASRFGAGSGASHLINGHSHEHHALEQELAAFTGRERALLFSTGYMANMGVISALAGKGDLVLQDKINHASLLDGGFLSGAELKRYRHVDLTHLRSRLQNAQAKHKLIVTDGVFSMDGDVAPLPEISALCEEFGAWLMVDDAHGFGCLAPEGRGTVHSFGLNQDQVPVLIGTLGKAFGTFGAFVAGSEALIESLIQFSRTYIYTTALPPAVAAATRVSLKLLIAAEDRREHLQQLIALFKLGCASLGLELMESASPIQPIMVGSDEQALTMSQLLMEKGCWVSAIRPPTVPEGTARLRVTLTARHTPQQVAQLLDALAFAKAHSGR